MPSPATFCPRDRESALGQRDPKFSRAGPRPNPEESQATGFSDFAEWKVRSSTAKIHFSHYSSAQRGNPAPLTGGHSHRMIYHLLFPPAASSRQKDLTLGAWTTSQVSVPREPSSAHGRKGQKRGNVGKGRTAKEDERTQR